MMVSAVVVLAANDCQIKKIYIHIRHCHNCKGVCSVDDRVKAVVMIMAVVLRMAVLTFMVGTIELLRWCTPDVTPSSVAGRGGE